MCKIGDVAGVLGMPTGPSGTQLGLQQEGLDLGRELEAHYTHTFAQQQDALTNLKALTSQMESGGGEGLSAADLAAQTGQIIAGAAGTAAHLAQKERELGAGRVFGSDALGRGGTDSSGLARSSAINRQLTEEAGAVGENQMAGGLRTLAGLNEEVRMANLRGAMSSTEATAQQYGAAANESLRGAQTQGKQNWDIAGTIKQEQDAAAGGFGKMLLAGGKMALAGITGGIAGGGGLLDTLKGVAGGITGQDFLSNPKSSNQDNFTPEENAYLDTGQNG
jgi:hypothetical protein